MAQFKCIDSFEILEQNVQNRFTSLSDFAIFNNLKFSHGEQKWNSPSYFLSNAEFVHEEVAAECNGTIIMLLTYSSNSQQ